MSQLIVRNLEESVKASLRLMAARNGHSMEEEARNILRAGTLNALHEPPKKLGTWIAERFRGQGLPEPIQELRGDFIKPVEFD